MSALGRKQIQGLVSRVRGRTLHLSETLETDLRLSPLCRSTCCKSFANGVLREEVLHHAGNHLVTSEPN